MKKEFKILIADRNSNVREFLKREMTDEGYAVVMAENGRDVLKWVYNLNPVDLLILDPDLPDADESLLLMKLNQKTPYIPVVLHTFFSDYIATSKILALSEFVEKGGNSIEQLKKIIETILKNNISTNLGKG
ncbi:MAG: response regulator [Proteobacteria bacterium]|nr:response regulator [Pseudomonadota bacterium]